MTESRIELWTAINEYTEACGGNTGADNDSDRRMDAVVAVERAVDAEVERYKQWVDDLHAGCWINCVYCGHRYGPDDEVPASMADVLKEHVENCPEHPMSKLKKERDELREKCDRIKGVRGGLPCGCQFDEEDEPVKQCLYHHEIQQELDRLKHKEEYEPLEPALLYVEAYVRYWEDASVNGFKDNVEGFLVPCRMNDLWCPIIELDTGRILDWPRGTWAKIHYKVCDGGVYWLMDRDRTCCMWKWKDHYVPKFLDPENRGGDGDYIILDIDTDGVIRGWDFTFDPDKWEDF